MSAAKGAVSAVYVLKYSVLKYSLRGGSDTCALLLLVAAPSLTSFGIQSTCRLAVAKNARSPLLTSLIEPFPAAAQTAC